MAVNINEMLIAEFLDRTILCEWAYPKSPCEISVRVCLMRYQVANSGKIYNAFISKFFSFDECQGCGVGQKLQADYEGYDGPPLINMRNLQYHIFATPQKSVSD